MNGVALVGLEQFNNGSGINLLSFSFNIRHRIYHFPTVSQFLINSHPNNPQVTNNQSAFSFPFPFVSPTFFPQHVQTRPRVFLVICMDEWMWLVRRNLRAIKDRHHQRPCTGPQLPPSTPRGTTALAPSNPHSSPSKL